MKELFDYLFVFTIAAALVAVLSGALGLARRVLAIMYLMVFKRKEAVKTQAKLSITVSSLKRWFIWTIILTALLLLLKDCINDAIQEKLYELRSGMETIA